MAAIIGIFGRPNASPIQKGLSGANGAASASRHPKSYVNVVNGASKVPDFGPVLSAAFAFVLDDSCATILRDEGFSDVNLSYLGGLWVLFECDTVDTKVNLMQHTCVLSWFHIIQDAVHDFVSDERIVWVNIEGVPLNVWSRETFIRISKVWMVRAKELVTWNPILLSDKETEYSSDVESAHNSKKGSVHSLDNEEASNVDSESDVKGVAETIFVDNNSSPINNFDEKNKLHSRDVGELDGKVKGVEEFPSAANANVMNTSQVFVQDAKSDSINLGIVKSGGSVLGVLEDMIRVGQAMGYKMYGCVEDLERIIGNQGADDEYVSSLIGRWNSETVIMGDFNEVRSIVERHGSCFNPSSARAFDHFISSSALVDVKLEGYAFTWSHPSGSKMSKLDRFLVSEDIFSNFPSISALCLERHLSDHRPILLCEVLSDFGPIPLWFYHSWFNLEGFDAVVEKAWCSFSHTDANRMIRFKKKLQDLKVIIRGWVKNSRAGMNGDLISIKEELCAIDKEVDGGVVLDYILLRRMELQHNLHDFNQLAANDSFQKSKVKWAIEGDENSKFFHVIINRKRSHFVIRGVFDKASNLERNVSHDEIRSAIWGCRENKSPGSDGYSFEFLKKYWNFVGPDICEAVGYFFKTSLFYKGCNSSFVALILKVTDAKLDNDFRPISLIGCVSKVVTKILANRLSLVIADLVSNTQSAFVANRHILDGPFILNEILHWCKRKNKQVMFFKVNFAKAYDSVRWDYLLDVLEAFGFGQIWCNWIRGTLSSTSALVLVNGSPSNKFSFHCRLKQGDPLSPFLFILIMESLHLSFSRAVDEGVFKGVQLNGSLSISHVFYADDVMFIGEWSDANLKGVNNILQCFFLASGLKINIYKSQELGVGILRNIEIEAAASLGYGFMLNQFRYLCVMVGNCMSRHQAWDDVVLKLRSRLSKWKVKTLSIGGRLVLLKSVLGASLLYNMSIFKVPKGILKNMEMTGSNFFNGFDYSKRNITWAAWDKILASKENGGLGDRNATRFWFDKWIGDKSLLETFPCLFVLELDKEIMVADNMKAALDLSFRRHVQNGVEHQQLEELYTLMDSVSLSQSKDRWVF
nr:putative RNA-directed DNA polymerase, eukaryota, reverse transcriptase zinc-binding domain protein [Tanacetum cinerariifolium]